MLLKYCFHKKVYPPTRYRDDKRVFATDCGAKLTKTKHDSFFFNYFCRNCGRIAVVKRVLLPIKPKYAAKIMMGEKKVEFRKMSFPNDVQEIAIYASSPVKVDALYPKDLILSEFSDGDRAILSIVKRRISKKKYKRLCEFLFEEHDDVYEFDILPEVPKILARNEMKVGKEEGLWFEKAWSEEFASGWEEPSYRGVTVIPLKPKMFFKFRFSYS